MAERRHHSDIAIAGLIVLGAIGLVNDTIEPEGLERATWGGGAAFFAGWVARRALPDLDLGELALAAAAVSKSNEAIAVPLLIAPVFGTMFAAFHVDGMRGWHGAVGQGLVIGGVFAAAEATGGSGQPVLGLVIGCALGAALGGLGTVGGRSLQAHRNKPKAELPEVRQVR